MSEIWGIPYPYKLGLKTTYFRRLHNLKATLTAYVFGINNDIHNSASVLETTTGLLHRLKMS